MIQHKIIISDINSLLGQAGGLSGAAFADTKTLTPPDDGVLLVVTNDHETARKAVSDETGKVYTIFVGAYADVKDIAGKLLDIRHPDEPAELLAISISNAVGKIRSELDLWFYRHTLETTIDTVPDMLWYKRLDGIHMMVNDAFTNIVHKSKEDVAGKDHFYIWDAPRPTEGNEFTCAESEEIAISTGQTYICDEPVKTHDGMMQLVTYKTPLYDKFGTVFGTVGVGHDVTNFSRMGIELSILIENIPFPMTIFSSDWKILRMNSLFREILGDDYTDDFDYKSWKLTKPIPAGTQHADPKKHSVTREYRVEVGGELRSYIFTELEIHDFFDNITGYFCTMQDVTYQRTYENSIIKAANTDILTGMYNRRYFYQLLGTRRGLRYHLIYLDLDHFKQINDNYGHTVGDEVLVKTAELIHEHFPDAISARLGGDEFALVDDLHSADYLTVQCERFRDDVENSFAEYDQGTSVSIGISYNDGTTKNIDELIHESDERMYTQKRSKPK